VCSFRCEGTSPEIPEISPEIPDFPETAEKSPEYPGFTNKFVLSGYFQDSPIHPPSRRHQDPFRTQPGGSQLPGATGEAQPGASQLRGVSGGAQPGTSQLPDASGGAQQSPGGSQLPGASGGQPGSSHEVAGSTAAVVTPQPTGDARRRQIHPPDPLTYLRKQTHAATRAARLLKKPKRC
jgi:hypothetical protein